MLLAATSFFMLWLGDRINAPGMAVKPADRSWWPAFLTLPGWGLAWRDLARLDSAGWLLAPAALIAVIHSQDALSTARMLPKACNARRELLAQGLANMACGLGGGIGVTATPSLSHALAAAGAGGRWGRALLVGWVVLCVWALWALWDVVALLPIPVLGALVAATGVGMFIGNLSPLRIPLSSASLAHLDQHLGASVVWLMLILAMFTPLSALWVVGVGTALTVLIWVYQSSGKLVFRQYSGLQRRSLEHRSPANDERLRAMGHQVQVLEIEGDLFFGTAPLLREHLLAAYPKPPADGTAQRYLVLDFSRLDQMDSSGLSCLRAGLKTLGESPDLQQLWPADVRQATLASDGHQCIDAIDRVHGKQSLSSVELRPYSRRRLRRSKNKQETSPCKKSSAASGCWSKAPSSPGRPQACSWPISGPR